MSSQSTSQLQFERNQSRALVFCSVAILFMVGAGALPPISLYGGKLGNMLGVHLLLEMFSVVVSLLVVMMALHTIDRARSDTSKALIYGFSIVAGSDLIHALSYEGMPPLLVESSTERAIFFWFVSRTFELIALVLVAAGVRLPFSRHTWLVFGVLTIAAMFLLGTFALDRFPDTFVPGRGVTPFKAFVEYGFCVCFLLVAGWLFVQYRADREQRTLYIAVACFIMAIAGIAFTSYVTPSDFINFVGHLYKIVAYGLVFRAMFLTGLREPYELLEQSERRLRDRETELETLLSQMPAGVSLLDRELRFRYINPINEAKFGIACAEAVGRHLEELMPAELIDTMKPRFIEALGGQRVEFDYAFTGADGMQRYRAATLVPDRNAEGGVDGVVAITNDTTQRERARRQLLDSLREISELKAALDAHAIVAVTDARGVITRVNDKFCSISQYSRDELIGQTHRIINSGHHPRSFFIDLWRTISGGQAWHGEICNKARDGSLYWVYTTIVPFVGLDGVPLQYIAIRADITQRKRAEQEAQRLAFHDELTALPNRRLMRDRLGQAIASAARDSLYGALLLMDLDNFKEVNDTLGHSQGDELLRQVSARLLQGVRQSDTVARLGGDEFVLLVGDLGPELDVASARAGDFGEKIRQSLMLPYDLNGHGINVTSSIGIVLFRNAADDPDELIKQADMALYRAKASGRNRLSFFDPELQSDVTTRALLVRDLRQVLERAELRLHYQPIVDARRHIRGVEALVRWQHPTRGMVSPASFIPLAEQTNLIQAIGQWVLNVACAQLASWALHPVRSHWTVAVNVSERQFCDAGFVESVLRAIERSGADARLLRLEITESMLHNDLDMTLSKMDALRRQGVKFSLDDFGTGYSSLSYLKKLPLHQLKIDKSFVDDVLTDASDAAIVRTMVSLAGNLEMGVVAEGVETEAQMDFLVSCGCQGFQGYLYSRPVPAEQLPDGADALIA
ncbi:MAG: EAL domain-containing protein [Methyloversatilis sp.]|nr:EAL domain-containing protein [Methyloversatilis sp.]